MTTLREAAQQALEALNVVSDEGESKFPGTIQGAISDLEAALAQERAEPLTEEEIERIRADEREACAKVCEGKAETDTRFWYDYRRGVLNCAAAIRARSKA